MAIYIAWQETEHKFKDWYYVGNGETRAVFEEVTIVKKALYSNEETAKMESRAIDYIKQDRPSAWIVKE